MEAIAKTKYLKGSPRKARLVIDLIRGEDVSRALNILRFTDKRAADPISKCLNSAIANATYKAEQQNIAIDPDDLWIKACFVDMGPTKGRRRMRPAPQGRAYREQRHYCHITIEVTSDEKPKSEKELRAEAAKAKRAAEEAAQPKKKKARTPAAKKTKAEQPDEVDTTTAETGAIDSAAEVQAEETAPTEAVETAEESAAEPVEAAEAGVDENLDSKPEPDSAAADDPNSQSAEAGEADEGEEAVEETDEETEKQ